MLTAGWTAADPKTTSADVGRFVRPLGDRFLAIAFFPWFRPTKTSTIHVAARLGIDYEPACDLLNRLTWSPVCGAVLKKPADHISISTGIHDVSTSTDRLVRLADRLVHFVALRSPVLADLANVDTIIKILREHQAVPCMSSMMTVYAGEVADATPGEPFHPSAELELIPALLAAGGRYEEARRALTQVTEGDSQPTQFRRFARQLTRFLDSGGELDLPTTPPRWPPHPVAPQREASAVTTEQPISTAHLLRGVVKDVTNLLSSAITLSSSKSEQSDELLWATLAWLEPPDRAAYPIWMITGSWTAVELDPGANDWLTRAWDATTSASGGTQTREVKVWLTWASEPPKPDTRLDVHLGTRHVGRLAADAAQHFQLPMEAAAQRDEDPWARARISAISRDQPLLLEVAVPTRQTASG